MTTYFRIWPLFKGPKLGQPNFLYSLCHIPVQDLQNAGSIIFLSYSAYAPIQLQNEVHFSLNPYLTPYLRGHNGVKPIFDIAYATVPLQTFQTRIRSTFYLIPSRHLFNCKMTFETSGRRGCRGITLTLCT